MAKQLTRIKLRFCYYWGTKTWKITNDWVCAKTDVSRMVRVTKVTDSPMFCDKTEYTSLFMKQML